jgi:hypothetical protein
MVGGIITSFLMELTLFPAIFYIVKKKEVLQLVSGQPEQLKPDEGQ